MGISWPPRKKKAHKFNLDPDAPRTSKLERAVYQILLLREKAGEISDIRQQESVLLGYEEIVNARTLKRRTRAIRWKVDFSFFDRYKLTRVYCEAKGVETSLYRKQLRLWREGAGPGELEIWKGNYRRPTLTEVVKVVEV